jgi:hypothetical protein
MARLQGKVRRGALALCLACGGDDGGGPAGDTEVGSGFEGPGSGSGSETDGTITTTDNPTSGPTSTSTTDDTESGYETLGDGPLRGTLTFVHFAADALNDEAIVGMAGAWRDESIGFGDVYDFFGIFGLGINFPAPPADEDTLEHNDIPADFEWGAPGDWLLAGTAMKLRLPDSAAHACLLYRGGTPEIELPPGSGTFYPNYPVYASTDSSNQPEDCRPDPSAWIPDTDYDIVLYGGELFDDNSLVAQVHTPTELQVTAPDIAQFQLPIDITENLEVTWNGEGLAGNRIVIRVFDVFGRMFTIHADDDGSYNIPADALGVLSQGPGTIVVARENVDEVPFTDGVVTVVTRYEHWGYVDLF